MRSMNTTEQEMADAIAKILQPRKVLVAFWKALDEAIKEVDALLPTEELAEALLACADELDTYEWGDHGNTHNILIRARAALKKAGLACLKAESEEA